MGGQTPDLIYSPNDLAYDVVESPPSVGHTDSLIRAIFGDPDFYLVKSAVLKISVPDRRGPISWSTLKNLPKNSCLGL